MTLALCAAGCGETGLPATVWVGQGTGPASGGSAGPGMSVHGRSLRDACGDEVVLRGVNEMVGWSAGRDGVPEFSEIAKAGANAVRVVWTLANTSAELDGAVTHALAADLLPLVELHDGMGDFSKLPELVAYWTTPPIVEVIEKHQRFLMVAIGSGVGNAHVPAETWEAGYVDAIRRMRSAGISTPIVVDAPNWGQDIERLRQSGPALLAADPLHNLIFSVAMWWPDGDAARIHSELLKSVNAELPLIVGEFSSVAALDCPAYPFDYRALLAESRAMQIGYFAWSWGGVKNADCPGHFDMTRDGTFAELYGWGLEVAVTNTNSIHNSAVRSRSLTTGCE